MKRFWPGLVAFLLLVGNLLVLVRWLWASNSIEASETNEYLPVSQKLYQAFFFHGDLLGFANQLNVKHTILVWFLVPFLGLTRGEPLGALRLYSLAVFALTVLLVWCFFRQFVDRPRAFLATAAFAGVPWVYQSAHNFSAELPMIACVASQFLAAIRLRRDPSGGRAILLGFALATGFCLRPLESLAGLLPLAVFLLAGHPRRWRPAHALLALGTAFLLTTAWYAGNGDRVTSWIEASSFARTQENNRAAGDWPAYVRGWLWSLVGIHGILFIMLTFFPGRAGRWRRILRHELSWALFATVFFSVAYGTVSANPEYRYFVSVAATLFLFLLVPAVRGHRFFALRSGILLGLTVASLYVAFARASRDAVSFPRLDNALSGSVWLDRGDLRENDEAETELARELAREFSAGMRRPVYLQRSGFNALLVKLQAANYWLDVRPSQTVEYGISPEECGSTAARLLDSGAYFLLSDYQLEYEPYMTCEKNISLALEPRAQVVKSFKPRNRDALRLIRKKRMKS